MRKQPVVEPLARNLADTRLRLRKLEHAAFRERQPSRSRWKLPELDGDWDATAGFELPGYALDNDGFVHMKGVVGGGSSGTTAFTLPEDLRPRRTQMIGVAAAGGMGLLVVGTDGTVVPTNFSGSSVTTWVSLNTRFSRRDYDHSSVVISREQLSVSDGMDVPHTRMRLGGMVVAAGSGPHHHDGGSGNAHGSVEDVIGRVSPSHGHPFQLPLILPGEDVGGDSQLRVDIASNALIVRAGGEADEGVHISGAVWPSVGMLPDMVQASNGTGVTDDTPSGDFRGGLWCLRDSSGWCWVGGVVSISNATAGAEIVTVPLEYRPSSTVMLMGSNPLTTAAGLELDSDGKISLAETGSSGYVGLSCCYWLDN